MKMNDQDCIVREDVARIFDRLGPAAGDSFTGKRILVTGCAGFLGRLFSQFFAGELARRGAEPERVVLADNFMLGRPAWLERLAGRNNRAEIRRLDIANPGAAGDDFGSFHYIVHLASIASPTFYRRHPFETLDANVWGLRRLIDTCDPGLLAGLLFFSSSEIYGDPDPAAIPTPEDYPGLVHCRGPRACYDEAKRFGETLCHLAGEVRGLKIATVRPFNNYGPGMRLDDRRVPADFASAVLSGRDIVILSDGSPTRTFCYVADAVFGYLLALLKGAGQVFNIGSPGPEIGVGRLAEVFAAAGRAGHGYTGRIVFAKSGEADYLTHNPRRRCPDISRAREALGYAPEVGLEEGVARYLTHLAAEMEG
jgi:UDP-glucuronate decarboxylase